MNQGENSFFLYEVRQQGGAVHVHSLFRVCSDGAHMPTVQHTVNIST